MDREQYRIIFPCWFFISLQKIVYWCELHYSLRERNEVFVIIDKQ
jgi:hypothetical protein